MGTAADLAREQAHLDEAYRALAAMRDRTERAVGIAAADAASGEVDAYATEAHLRRRLRELEVDVPGLAFGRITEERDSGEGNRIGRRHVETPAGDTLVVDWRAPAATPFYRATAADPQGLRLRRRFATEGSRIEALFDEDFTDPDSIEAAHGGVPDPLLAELERARTSEMRDIVATIAAEQDVIIRAPLDRCLVVQGGPGTGKTAVGLHRAAFLLYEHRQQLMEAGVLVVGPNPTFLRYISAVLPSLGEGSVRQATLAGLVGVGSDAPLDERDRAVLLGDRRMAEVAAAALHGAVRPPEGDLRFPTAWGPVLVDAGALAEAQTEFLARGVSHDTGRTAMRTRLVRLIRRGVEERRSGGEGLLGEGVLEDDLRRRPELARAVAALWPSISGPSLGRRLLTSRRFLSEAAEGILDDDEQRAIVRRAARKLGDEVWTAAEAVVLDECRALVEGVARTYGHVVVDEAQDLTAMGYRAVRRRCPTGSLTILGDLAQATVPGAQTEWFDVLEHLGFPDGADLAELALGYRVPATVLDWANGLLAEAAPGVRPARSVRAGGREPRGPRGRRSRRRRDRCGGVAALRKRRRDRSHRARAADRRRAARHPGRGQGPRVRRGGRRRTVSDRRARRRPCRRSPSPLRRSHPGRAGARRGAPRRIAGRPSAVEDLRWSASSLGPEMTTLLVVLAATTAVVAAARSTWSPCGLSMISTITPMGERARRYTYRGTAAWFVLGGILGGATLGLGAALLAALVGLLDLDPAAALAIGGLLALVGAASDAHLGGFRLPGHTRQVNEVWLDRYRSWVYGSGFGWQIGVGLATFIVTAAVYLMIALAALTGAPATAFLLCVGFGFLRGLAVLLSRHATTTAQLQALHRRFDELATPSWRATIVAQIVIGAVALIGVGGPWATVVGACAGALGGIFVLGPRLRASRTA